MAYPPSPPSASLPGAFQRYNRYSLSPPQPQISKRDKKRKSMMDRLTQISNEFAENRDVNYRKEVHQHQADMNYINTAKLYDNKVLNDFEDDSFNDLDVSAAPSTQGSLRQGQQGHFNGSTRAPSVLRPSKHAIKFTHDINDATEKKDADLVTCAYRHNFTIEELQFEYSYAVAVAHAEHKRLYESVRQRLIANVQSKKAALIRDKEKHDKEKHDTADTSFLLHKSTQFGVASPGGPQSNRKTRHTRQRLEIEETENNTSTLTDNGRKRNRRVFETQENGSPARDVEPQPSHTPHAASQSRLEYNHSNANGDNQYQSPSSLNYTIDRLFTDRELNIHLQASCYDVIDQFAKRPRRNPPSTSSSDNIKDDLSDTELNANLPIASPAPMANDNEKPFLGAPEMERSTTNQSYHATRSTRMVLGISGAVHPTGLHNQNGTARIKTLGKLAGKQAAADNIGTYQRELFKGVDGMRAPPLTEQEGREDLERMEKAMKEEEEIPNGRGARRGADEEKDRLLDEVCGYRTDWVGDGIVESRNNEEDDAMRNGLNGAGNH